MLRGGPAIVAATAPYFSASLAGSLPGTATRFNSESPAGKLAQAFKPLPFIFEDPYKGQGGFGGSTAEFALTYAFSRGIEDSWEKPYGVYRELTSNEPIPPSGADLIAQWSGGVIYWCPKRNDFRKLNKSFPWRNLLVFSASHQPGRKVPTHGHLATLQNSELLIEGSAFLKKLEMIVIQALDAIEHNQSRHFATALNEYGDELARNGLEIEASTRDRAAFRGIHGVLAVKGSGALQADSILVYVEGEGSKQTVLDTAKRLGLRVVASSLAPEHGMLGVDERDGE